MIAYVSDFSAAKETIAWAKDATAELDRSLAQFFAQKDIGVLVTEFDVNTGDHVHKFKLVKHLPSAIPRKVTEALLNARHSFDQSLFCASCLVAGRPLKDVYFPWSQTPTDLQRRIETKGIIPQELWDTLRQHEPYPRSEAYAGGNDLIRSLAAIVNDKHTVGVSVMGSVVGFSPPAVSGGVIKGGGHFGIRAPKWNFEKNEMEIYRLKNADLEIKGQTQIAFAVVFKDARLPHPVNVVQALQAFIAKAERVQEDLERRCVELGHGPSSGVRKV